MIENMFILTGEVPASGWLRLTLVFAYLGRVCRHYLNHRHLFDRKPLARGNSGFDIEAHVSVCQACRRIMLDRCIYCRRQGTWHMFPLVI